jgi:hypothetical protein
MKRSPGIIGLLLLLFAAPGVIAYLLYLHPEWSSSRTNHGQFLQPPPVLQQMPQNEKWQLLYWMPQTCTQDCLHRLDELAKLRLALGRRLYSVDLVLASQTALSAASQTTQNLLEEVDAHWAQLSGKEADILGSQPAIYLVNPQRYVILAYASDQALKDIFQDLQKMVHDK